MKTIRTNCFETNSSSTHSFTIDKSYRNASDDNCLAVVRPGEFGWEWRSFNDPQTKASYLWTMALSYDKYDNEWAKPFESLKKNLLEIGKKYLVEFITPASDSFHYVDHASDHLPKLYAKFPETKTVKGLWKFITDSSYWIMLGNDNGYGPANFRLTPNQIANATRFLYLDIEPNVKYALAKEDDTLRVAEHALFAYQERTGTDRWDAPYAHIVDNDGRTMKVNYEKYDHKTNKSTVVKSEEVTYTVYNTVIEKQVNIPRSL